MRELDASVFDDASIPPETLAVNAAIRELTADLANWWDVGAEKVRAARARGEGPFPAVEKSPRARTVEIDRPGSGERIALRVIAPERPRGVYLHFHGGGWVLGAADQQDRLLERIADATRLTAVSVEYRLAPEHPFPAGPDDCESAAHWVVAHARELAGGDALAVGGESAGGYLSALTLLRVRDRLGRMPFHAANLVFGAFDLGLTPSARNFGEERLILRTSDIEHFTDAFVPDAGIRRAPHVSPLYADLRGLCPALFTVGTKDALLYDSLFMHARWCAAGNRAELAVYPGAAHGFIAFPAPQTFAAIERQTAFLNAVLG